MDRSQLIVVGGGPAGASAAIQAADLGLGVTLIDENPIDFSMMGLDIPYYFGQRMMPSLRDKGLTLQRVVSSNQLLKTAQERGIEVLPGAYVWGSFRNRENSRQLERPVLGLADEDRSWLMEYDRLVLAPGARDLVLGFPGRELVGVMGANAVASLLDLYQGLTAKKMVVLGSGDLGLSTAAKAMAHGVEIAAVVDISARVRGSDGLRSRLEARGVPFYTSCTVKEAPGHREVQSITIVSVDSEFRPVQGTEREVECDTICMAMGLVPNVELPHVTGCSLAFRHDFGGFVAETDDKMQTTVEGVYIAGDGAGFDESMVSDSGIAVSQGRLAALATAESLGALDAEKASGLRRELGPTAKNGGDGSTGQYRSAWMTSLVAAGGMEVNVCQCEEVTRRDLLNVAAPTYLGWSSEQMDRRSMQTWIEEATVNLDRLKRLTRAGMGYCQGRRCREEIALLVAQAAQSDISEIPLASYRPPVRPLPMRVLWPQDEPEEIKRDWRHWFKPPEHGFELLGQRNKYGRRA